MRKFLWIVLLLVWGNSVMLGQTQTFNYTGAMQQYVVPPGVTGICYTVCGAQGMGNVLNNMGGGLGGRVMGVLSVVPGQILEIWVGQGGIASNNGGFNGGARGGSVACCPNSRGGGGGGASDIRVAPYGLANRVAVGGGGGGTGGNRVQGCSPGCGGGGGGGYYGGGGGGAYGGSPGFGGSQVAGGNGGASCCGCPLAPQAGFVGALGVGGRGGDLAGCNNQAANNPGCAGGVGGGLVGGQGPNCTGGTGCPSTWAGASGGGGSSFGIAASTPTITSGVQAGNGIVILNPNCCAAPSLTVGANPASICPGAFTTLTVTGAGAGGSYTWMPGNLSGTNISVSPAATQVYTVQGATATSTCAGSETVLVTVMPVPVPVVNNPTACAGSPLVFNANGGAGYAWTGPGGFNSAVQNPTVVNAQTPNSGNYTVIVTGANGCTASAVSSASVANIPLPVTVGNNTACSQTFNGSTNTVALQAMGGNSYTWTTPAGFFPPSGTGQNFVVTSPVTPVPIVGGVTVTITGALGCTAQAVHDVTVIPNPVLVFVPAQPTLCAGKSVQMTVTGALNYSWAGPFLSTTSGSAVVASPTANTTYTVVGSGAGCNSDNHFITATVVPNPFVFIASATSTICYGSSLNMNAVGASNYTWYPNSAISNTSMASVIVNPVSTTVYTVVGEAATCTTIAIREVSVIPLPTIFTMASKTVICQGERATITANGASNYQWTPIAGIIGSSTTNFIEVSPVVSTTYNLVGQNGACTGTAVVPIDVIPLPDLGLSTSNNQICKGNSTTIFASGAQSYVWGPMSGLTMIAPNTASANPAVTTNYTVTGFNTNGTKSCPFTKEIEIIVIQKIVPVVSGNTEVCAGQSVKLVAQGGNTYKWIPLEGLDFYDKDIVYASPSVTTIYTVDVSVNGNCGETTTVQVKVNPSPTVNAGPDVTYNLDDPMYLNAQGTGTLTWIFGQEVYCSVCPNTQIFPKTSGCYQIQAVNEYDCKATDEVCVEVTTLHNMYIPNIFTPNEDGKNDLFTVYGTGFTKIEVSIFDRWGAKLYTFTDINKGWDGTYKGVLVKEDTYVYKVNYTSLDGKKHTKTGHVTLMK